MLEEAFHQERAEKQVDQQSDERAVWRTLVTARLTGNGQDEDSDPSGG